MLTLRVAVHPSPSPRYTAVSEQEPHREVGGDLKLCCCPSAADEEGAVFMSGAEFRFYVLGRTEMASRPTD